MSEACGGRVERGWVDGVWSSQTARLSVLVCASVVVAGGSSSSVRRTPVALNPFFVVHTEVRRLCADVRPHLGRPRLHVLVDSASECDRAGNTVAKRTSTLCHGSSSVSHAYHVLTLLTRGRLRPLFPSAQLPPGTHPLPLSFRSYVSLSLYLLLVK